MTKSIEPTVTRWTDGPALRRAGRWTWALLKSSQIVTKLVSMIVILPESKKEKKLHLFVAKWNRQKKII